MPRVNGQYSLPNGYKAVPGQTIRATQHNPPLEDLAQAMTDSLPRDGSAPMTGALAMNGKKVTGLAKGTAASDAVRLDQINPYSAWLASVSALTMQADRMVYATGATTSALTTVTAFGRSVIAAANAAAARVVLGITAAQDFINRFNDGVAHSSADWAAGTLTTPGIPSPEQINGAIKNTMNISGNAPAYSARAWCLFQGSTAAIVNSGNVASVVRTAEGRWTVTFAVPMQNEKYAVAATAGNATSTPHAVSASARTASGFNLTCAYATSGSNGYTDSELINFVVYR